MSTQDTYKYQNLLVVVDPTRNAHPAFERALASSTLDIHPKVHLFIGVDLTTTDSSADNPQLYKSTDELTALLQPLEEKRIAYTAEVCWSSQWQEAILTSAERCKADMIIVSDYSREKSAQSDHRISRRPRLSDAKWALLRNASCPVYIVRPNPNRKRKTILAAVKTQTVNARYEAVNKKIIARGKWLAALYGADFHVVNAYPDSLNYPDRGQLRRIAEMDSSKVHVKQGSPEDVIVETALQIDADIVVIGTLARKGMVAAMRGNTSEKLLEKLAQDILTIN